MQVNLAIEDICDDLRDLAVGFHIEGGDLVDVVVAVADLKHRLENFGQPPRPARQGRSVLSETAANAEPQPASDDDDDDDDDDGSGGSDDEAPKIAKKPKKEAAEPKPKKRKAEPKKEKAEPKKKRKKKDPNAPKGKSSAYIMFGNAKRAEVKEQHPDFSLGDIGRELGKRWKELTDDDKKPYVDLATADAERYDREMAAYKAKQQAEGAGGGDDSDDE